jgi:hypothetical protein
MFLGSWHSGIELTAASTPALQQARSSSPTARGFRRGFW